MKDVDKNVIRAGVASAIESVLKPDLLADYSPTLPRKNGVASAVDSVLKPDSLADDSPTLPIKRRRNNYRDDKTSNAKYHYAKALMSQTRIILKVACGSDKYKDSTYLLDSVGEKCGISGVQMYKFFVKGVDPSKGQGRPSIVDDALLRKLLAKYARVEYDHAVVKTEVMKEAKIDAKQAGNWVSRCFRRRMETYRQMENIKEPETKKRKFKANADVTRDVKEYAPIEKGALPISNKLTEGGVAKQPNSNAVVTRDAKEHAPIKEGALPTDQKLNANDSKMEVGKPELIQNCILNKPNHMEKSTEEKIDAFILSRMDRRGTGLVEKGGLPTDQKINANDSKMEVGKPEPLQTCIASPTAQKNNANDSKMKVGKPESIQTCISNKPTPIEKSTEEKNQTNLLVCTTCEKEKPKNAFGKRQKRFPNTNCRKCNECIITIMLADNTMKVTSIFENCKRWLTKKVKVLVCEDGVHQGRSNTCAGVAAYVGLRSISSSESGAPNVEIIKHALQKNGFGQIITSLSEGSRYVKGQFVELAESLKVCAKFDGYVASSRHDGDFFAVENVRPMLQKLASMGKCAMCELSHFNYVLRSCSVFLV